MLKYTLVSLLLLSGCATAYDVDLWKEHGASVRSGHTSSAKIVEAKTMAISGLSICPEYTHTESILMRVILGGNIERITVPKFIVKAPRLNTDNVEPLTKATVGLAPFLTIERIVDKTAGEIGDENYSTEGGDIKVSKTEVHTTTAGDDNNISTGYESTDTTERDEEIKEEIDGGTTDGAL